MARVTREWMVGYINNRPRQQVEALVGRALVGLLKRQTQAEQAENETKLHNDVGFTGADGRSGAITAKYYIKHKKLLDWQLERWTKPNVKGVPRIAKYWKQLDEIAKEKKADLLKKEQKKDFAKALRQEDKPVKQEQPAEITAENSDKFNEDWAKWKKLFAENEREQEARAFERKMSESVNQIKN